VHKCFADHIEFEFIGTNIRQLIAITLKRWDSEKTFN